MITFSSRRAILTRGTAGFASLVLNQHVGRAAQPEQNDEQAVREVIASFAAAWSRHDVKGMGASHTDDVNFVNIWGSWEKGRVAIEQGFAAGHSSVFAQSKMVIDVEQVRFPAPDIGVAHSTMELLNVPPAFGGKCHSVRVLVRSVGRWLISDFQNTQIRKPPQ